MVLDDDISKLASSAVVLGVSQAVLAGSTLLERLVIARTLSPAAYGAVSVGLTLLSICTTVALLGFKQGVPRFVSRATDQASRRGVWVTAAVGAGGVSLFLVGGLLLFVDELSALLLDATGDPWLLTLFVCAVPLLVATEVGVAAIRGYEHVLPRAFARDLLYPLLRIGLLVVLLAAGYEIYAAGYAYLGATAVVAVVVHLLLHRIQPLVGGTRTQPRALLRFSLPLVAASVLGVLLAQTDTLMVGYFRPTAEVGLYNAAFPIAGGLLLLREAFRFMYLPVVSRLDADAKLDDVDALYKLTSKWAFTLSFPVVLTFVCFPDAVIGLVFGEAYVAAGPALALLAAGTAVKIVTGLSGETLSALGRTDAVLATNVVAFALNVGLNLLLIPRYGFVGAAVASVVAYTVLDGLAYLVLRQQYGISPFSPWMRRTVLVLVVGLTPPVFYLSRGLRLGAPRLAVTALLLAVAVAVLATLVGGLQPEDEIVVERAEALLGREVPYLRRWIRAA